VTKTGTVIGIQDYIQMPRCTLFLAKHTSYRKLNEGDQRHTPIPTNQRLLCADAFLQQKRIENTQNGGLL